MFLCTRITQFSLARLLIFAGKLINLSSDSAKDKKTNIFFKNCIFPQSVFLDAGKAILTNASRTFGQRAEKILLSFPIKTDLFVKIISLIKIILWTQKNAVSRTLPKNFRQKPENFRSMSLCLIFLKKCFFFRKIYVSSKSSYGHENCSFVNPAEKFLPQNRKKFAQCIKKTKESIFSDFSGKPFLQAKRFLCTHRMQFWQRHCNFFWQQAEKIQIDVGQWQNFFFKLFCLKLFIWTRRLQFWQPRQERFWQKPKNFRSLSKYDKKFFIQREKSLLRFPLDKYNAVLTTSSKHVCETAERF